MDFKVTFAKGTVGDFTGNSRYQIRDSGVLFIVDENGKRYQFSPTGWLFVEDQEQSSVYEERGPLVL